MYVKPEMLEGPQAQKNFETGKRVPGTCEKIGFADFGITHFQ